MQTLTTRRAAAAAARIQAMVAGSSRTPSTPAPPGSTRVSMVSGSGVGWATKPSPVGVVMGPPSGATTLTA